MRRSLTMMLVALVLVTGGVAQAQDQFPSRPITIVNPFPPGGLADLTGRPLAASMEYYLWIGLFVPKATPANVLKPLRDAVKQAVDDPAFKSAMDKIQTPIAYKDAEDFRKWWDDEAVRLAQVIQNIGRVETK